MYLPLIGVIALALAGMAWLAQRFSTQRDDVIRVLPVGLCAILTIVLGTTTRARNEEYATSLGMARTVLARWPTANAQQMVGTELLAAGRHEEAVPYLRAAAVEYPTAHYFLGQALFGAGHPAQAIPELELFLRDEPKIAPVPARLMIAKAYGADGRWPEATTALEQLLAIEPNHIEAHGLIAEALLQQQRWADAVPHYQAYLAATRGNASAWTNLGLAFLRLKRPGDAVSALQSAADAAPNDSRFRGNLARLLLDQGDTVSALREARQAIAINSGDPSAFEVMGLALARSGQLAEARAAFERVLAIDPTNATAVSALRQLSK